MKIKSEGNTPLKLPTALIITTFISLGCLRYTLPSSVNLQFYPTTDFLTSSCYVGDIYRELTDWPFVLVKEIENQAIICLSVAATVLSRYIFCS